MTSKLTVALAVLAVTVGGTPLTATSAAQDVMTTTFDGATTALGSNNCAAGAPGCVPIAEPAGCVATKGIGLAAIGAIGCFSFTGTVPATPPGIGCLFADVSLAPETGACTGVITADGNYVNAICGTGTVEGWASITSNIPGEGPIDFDFTISFLAGVGSMVIQGDAADSHGDGPGPGIVGGGVVIITPVPATACVIGPVLGFTALGAMTIILPDTGPV